MTKIALFLTPVTADTTIVWQNVLIGAAALGIIFAMATMLFIARKYRQVPKPNRKLSAQAFAFFSGGTVGFVVGIGIQLMSIYKQLTLLEAAAIGFGLLIGIAFIIGTGSGLANVLSRDLKAARAMVYGK